MKRMTRGALIGAALVLTAGPVLAQDRGSGDSSGSTARMLLRELDGLKEEMRELRGRLETQAHELEQMRQRQRNLYGDLDRRMRELEVGGAPSASGSRRPGDGDGQGVPSDAGAAGAGVPGQVPSDEGEDGQARSDVAPGDGEGDTAEARDAYREAFNQLKAGRYDASIETFEQFLDGHGSTPYADNAQYWLGESYYVTRRFDEAVDEFQKVLDDHPDSAKVPDAMLKIGYVRYEQQEWDAAREILERLVEEHPDTTAARLAGKRLQRMKLEGH